MKTIKIEETTYAIIVAYRDEQKKNGREQYTIAMAVSELIGETKTKVIKK